MTEKEILKFQKRARLVACKRGYSELADDFSQEIFVHWLSGHGSTQTIDQYFIDYLRALYGRSRDGSSGKRFKEQRNYVDLTEVRNLADNAGFIEPTKQSAYTFTGKELILYQLYFEEEMTAAIVAEILGVTESRVCQMLKSIKKEIQNQNILEQGYERMEWDESFLKLKVDWIQL
jgi:hypothetical protein